MDDALKHGGPAGAQSDNAQKQCQRQQDLILLAQAQFEGLSKHDRNNDNCRDRQSDGREGGSQCQIQAGLQSIDPSRPYSR